MPLATQLPQGLTSKGHCKFCGATYAKSAMTRHLQTCPARQVRPQLVPPDPRQKLSSGPILHLLVEGHHDPLYWIYLEIPAEATLVDLDNFLRDYWLECCGHLSAFEIGDTRYAVFLDREFDTDEKSMRGVRLARFAHYQKPWHYEYDYGTTTKLTLRIMGQREGQYRTRVKPVQVLAQNDAPAIPCDKCGTKPAVQVCTECRVLSKLKQRSIST